MRKLPITRFAVVTGLFTAFLTTSAINANAQSWYQRGSDIVGEAFSDYSGTAVAMSSDGKTVAIGAYANDGGGLTDRGHVRVYQWNGSAWTQLGSDIDGEAAGDESGSSVALSSDGKFLAIGAPRNVNGGMRRGHARVYQWNGSAWVQRGSDIDGEWTLDRFGYSVALSSNGNILAVGAPLNDAAGNDRGHVRVYQWNGSTWVQRGADVDGDYDYGGLGNSVALSSDGNVLAVGRPGSGDGVTGTSLKGLVKVYAWNGSAWARRGTDIEGEANYDNSGSAVAISSDGNTLAIGARYNDAGGTDKGHVRVHRWNGSAWVQRGNDIDGEANEDEFGSAVAISSDGNTIAAGAQKNDAGGSNKGHARLYRWNGSAWVQRGADIDGEANLNRSGSSLAFDADGNTVAIGAPFNSPSGHVRVYVSCASGTVTWDGGGSDERLFNRENWVGDLCPCAGADLVFNGTGANTKHCILDSSFSLGTISLNNTYKGRFRVEKTDVVLTADTLQTSGPMVVLNPETGTATIDVVNVSNNAFFNCASNAGIAVDQFNVGLAGYVSFRSKSNVYLGQLFVDQYSQFKGPQNGHIYLTGHLSIANRNTFDGNGATLHFTGTGNQNVDVSSANQIQTIPLVVNKASGAVVLQRNLNTDKLTLTSGNINTGSNKLTLTAPGGLFGGGSSSYINGKVGIDHSSAWPGSKMFLPIGKGSKYRPITLHNTSSTNTWEVEFMDSDPNTLGSANAPLSDIGADGYWSANRTAGGGGLLADATYFEIADAGKGTWNNGDLRVALFDGSTGWDDRGGSFTSNAVISSDNTLRGNAGYLLALGNDNGIPAPNVLVDGDVISGHELRTSGTSNTAQVAASRMVAFSVYPNPASETLRINLSGSDKGSITLSDLRGKVLGVYSAQTRSIDMRPFAAGVYFATFSNGSQRIAQRVIKH